MLEDLGVNIILDDDSSSSSRQPNQIYFHTFPGGTVPILDHGLEPVFRIPIHLIRIRIQFQNFRLNTDPDPYPILIQGFDATKIEKKLQLKKVLNFFGIKNYNLPIPRPP